jgi:hypothetical protein
MLVALRSHEKFEEKDEAGHNRAHWNLDRRPRAARRRPGLGLFDAGISLIARSAPAAVSFLASLALAAKLR